jgi:DNA-binding response OmpR family regulator
MVKMPEMDGIQALREIKSAYPMVEVIMLTERATVETAIEGARLGASDYLMKVCGLEGLVSKAREAGDRKSHHEQKILEAEAKTIAPRMGE